MAVSMIGLGGSVGGSVAADVLVVNSFADLESKKDSVGGAVGAGGSAETLQTDFCRILPFCPLSPQAAGKIVLFNAKFVTYGETVIYRVTGASAAAKVRPSHLCCTKLGMMRSQPSCETQSFGCWQVGAVGCLVRSISSFSMGNPHTGAMEYDATAPKIMAAAISTEHAGRGAHRGHWRHSSLTIFFLPSTTLSSFPLSFSPLCVQTSWRG